MSEYPDDPSPQYHGDVPPQDNDAERALLGAMLMSRDAIESVTGIVAGADYYRPSHEQIHDVIVDMYTVGTPVDMVTVHGELDRRGLAAKVGGAPYLHDLVSTTPIVANAAYYAERVRDKALLRRLADAGLRVRQLAMQGEDDAAAILDRAQAEMEAAVPRRTAEDYRAIGDVLIETLDDVEARGLGTGGELLVPTGFLDLDDLLGGFAPGQMVTVAGRPGLGKSTLALDFMRSASLRHGMASCMFTLEMTRHEVAMRLVSAETKVPLANLRAGSLSDGEWARIALHSGPITAAPLYIDDSPNLTMTEIRAKARRLKQTADLRLIVIDYLQLMVSGKRVENRQTEVSEFSRQVKLLAKELEVPVIALSQLNRGPEQRTSKRPLMSDLRESGSIEQDSDIVILLHRDDAYEKESSRPGEADLLVAKHRNGATRDIAVAAQLHYSRFADLAR